MGLWKSSIYRAHPLKFKNSTNIRVIELLPDTPEASLSCRLHVLPLENGPVYTALSYVWGDESSSKPILLDGKHHAVRENLWNFLSQYRHSQHSSHLWIDALCIDQSSIKERNHQVALMGKIYSSAKLVIAWLGHDFETSLSNVSTFDASASNIHQYVTSMIHLSSSTYWTRLWIVQEFVLATNLEIWSGHETTDGHMLAEAYVRYKQLPYGQLDNLKFDEFPVLDENFQRLKSLSIGAVLNSRHAFHERRGWRISFYDGSRILESKFLFGNFANAGCADARDRVYGVLGLLDQKELDRYPIVPDYSKSRSALFREIFVRQTRVSDWDASEWQASLRFAHSLKLALELDDGDENVVRVAELLVKLHTERKATQLPEKVPEIEADTEAEEKAVVVSKRLEALYRLWQTDHAPVVSNEP